ncbi:MAG: hypothetical protein QNJ30_11800 [Kiloniellales bacterium]|nr:hypothetical protein [Kiloniellales bacterium]
MSRAATPHQGVQKDPNIVALLSLQLLLLAFFILLNALSKFEDEKTRRVLESVNDTFNGQVQAVRNAASYSGAIGSLDDGRSLVAELKRLFTSALPATRVEQTSRANVFRLELPATKLFEAGSVELRSGRLGLLERISDALKRRQARGQGFRLRWLHGVASTRERRLAAPAPSLLEIRRLGQVIDELLARGVAADRLAIGVEPIGEGRMVLEIRLPEGPGTAGETGEQRR